jgi:hypothetical protein
VRVPDAFAMSQRIRMPDAFAMSQPISRHSDASVCNSL